jgi:Tfp pilus assembly protein PilO
MNRRYLMVGAGAVVVVLLFFLVVLKPKFAELSDVRADITKEQATTESLQLRLRQLKNAQKNQVETLARLAALNRALPPAPDLPGLIRQLQTVATNSGVDLLSISPSPPTPLANSTGISTVNVNIQVIGGFFRLETLLTRLEDLQRVLEVTSLSVSPQVDPVTGLTTLASTITFHTYVVDANAKVTGQLARPAPSASPSPAPTATTSLSPSPSPTRTR